MKRVGNLYETMLSYPRMLEAFQGVMRDKKHKSLPGSMSFMIMQNKDFYIAEAGRILAERSFKPRKPRESYRSEKGSNKIRFIQAPAIFPDQFIHWSLILAIQPVLMKGMDQWCCASIKGRGTFYAKNFIEKCLDTSNDKPGQIPTRKKYKYCLRMDIKKFFENINRERLMILLEQRIKDKEILDLCRKIIYSVPSKTGKGLPLGYYTSQWFANFYLQAFDHKIREVLMPKYGVDKYIRYMDDMIILGSNKRKLENLMKDIDNLLRSEFGLWLKETSEVVEITDENPIDFIGFRFTFDKTDLRPRIINHAIRANRSLYSGRFTIKKLQRFGSYNGWFMHTDTKEFQNNLPGDRKTEQHILTEMLAKKREEDLNSSQYRYLVKLVEDIKTLHNETQNKDYTLARVYPEGPRIVARSSYRFPDQDAYEEEQKRLKEEAEAKKLQPKPKKKKNNKRKNNRKPGTYQASAEQYFSDRDRESIIRDYNMEIREYELINANS